MSSYSSAPSTTTSSGLAAGSIVAPNAAGAPGVTKMAMPQPGAQGPIAAIVTDPALASSSASSSSHAAPLSTSSALPLQAGHAAPRYSQPEHATQTYKPEAIHHRYHIKVCEGLPTAMATTAPLTTATTGAAAPITTSLQPVLSTATPNPAAPITTSMKPLPTMEKSGMHAMPLIHADQSHSSTAALASSTMPLSNTTTTTSNTTMIGAQPMMQQQSMLAKDHHLHGKDHHLMDTHHQTGMMQPGMTNTSTTASAPVTAAATTAGAAAAAAAATAAMSVASGSHGTTAMPLAGHTATTTTTTGHHATTGHGHHTAHSTGTTGHLMTGASATKDCALHDHHHSGGMFCHNKAAAVPTAGMTKEEKKRHKMMLKEEHKREKLAKQEQKKRDKLAKEEQRRLAKETHAHHTAAGKTRATKYHGERDTHTRRLATDLIKWDTLHGQSAPIGRYNEWTEDTLPFTHENLGLFIAVARGMNLVDAKEAKADAYVKVILADRGADGKEHVHATHKSETIKNTANPQWLFHVDDTPHLLSTTAPSTLHSAHSHSHSHSHSHTSKTATTGAPLSPEHSHEWLKTGVLRIEVWDHDTFSHDDLLGWLEFPLRQLDNQLVRGDFQLQLPSTYASHVDSSLSTSRDHTAAAARKSKVTQHPGTVFLEIRYRSPFAFAGMRRTTAEAAHLQTGMSTGVPPITTTTTGASTTGMMAAPLASAGMSHSHMLEKRGTTYDLGTSSGMMAAPLGTTAIVAPITTSMMPAGHSSAHMMPLASSAQPMSSTMMGGQYQQYQQHQRHSSLLDLSNAQHAVPMPAMVSSFPSHGSPKFFYKEKDAKESMPSYTHPAAIKTAVIDANTFKKPETAFGHSSTAQPTAAYKHGMMPDATQPTGSYEKPVGYMPEILSQQPLTQQLMATSGSAQLLKDQQIYYQQQHPATATKPGEMLATQQPGASKQIY